MLFTPQDVKSIVNGLTVTVLYDNEKGDTFTDTVFFMAPKDLQYIIDALTARCKAYFDNKAKSDAALAEIGAQKIIGKTFSI